MAEKTLNTRIQQKHDSQTNWDKATNFIPKDGEIIIYDADANNAKPRIKVGDGTSKLSALPFITNDADILAKLNALDYSGATASGNAISFITQVTQTDGAINATKATIPVAASNQLGLVKSGTDITVDANGNVSVKNNSHNHTSANISDLSTTISTAITNAIGSLDAADPTADGTGTSFIATISQTDGAITATKKSVPTADGTTLGLVKGGGDVTISNGVITVSDDSHNHIISNVDGLQAALDAKATPGNITEAIGALDYSGATASGNSTSFITQVTQIDGLVSATKASIPIATSTQAGLVKSGTDITVDTSGNVSVNDNSHSHTSANISDLSTTISSAISSAIGALDASDPTASGDSTTFIKTISQTDGTITATKASIPTANGTTLGMVKQGGDVTIAQGVITVKDDSHNHIISNIDGLQNALNAKATPADITTAIGTLDFAEPTASGNSTTFIATLSQTDGVVTATKKNVPIADGTALGLVKGGGDVTIEDGVITVSDNSHKHTSSNISDLTTTINSAITTAINTLDASDPAASGTATSFISSISQKDGVITATKANITAAALGLSGAMRFLGTSATAITDGATTNPITIGSTSTTVAAGNVVLYGAKEFVWTGSKWEELGNEGSYKVQQTAVGSPATKGTAIEFIDTISQNAQGVISATKKKVASAGTSAAGLMSAEDKKKLDGITASADAVSFTRNATSGNKIGTITINDTPLDLYSPTQTSVSGNAGTSTTLKTARAIDGVNFDGSAAITHYGTCSTTASTAAKTVALTNFTLVTGARIAVKFTVTNTAASPTLNVNSTGAKAIMYRGAAISKGYLEAKRVYEFVYDGTNWELIGDINTDTNTKVTSVGNHYTPAEDTSAALSVDASSTTAATWNSTSLVTGVNLARDAKGHVTGITVDSIKMPANPNSNTTYTLSGKASGSTWVTTLTPSSGAATTSTVPAATQSAAGLMTAADKAKLDGIATGATANTGDITGVAAGNGLTGGGSSGSVTLNVGAGTGITVAADTVSAKLRSTTALTLDSAAATTTTGRVYPVAVDKTGYLAVNVPWSDTNTTYSAGTGLTLNTSNQFSVTTANVSTMMNLLGEGTSPAQLDDYLIAQYAGGGTTTTTYHRRKVSNVVNATVVKAALGTGAGTTKYLREDGQWIKPPNTTYDPATQSANGLMSKNDKLKLDNTNVAYGTCDTAAETAAKVVALSGNTQWKLTNGAIIMVKFTNSNSASSVTLNVNSTGAYPIWYSNAEYTGSATAYTGYAGRVITYMFNGTHWVWVSGSYDANTQSNTNSTDTSSKIYLIGATSQGSNKTTYSHGEVYVGTDHHVYSNSKQVVNLSDTQALTNKTYNGYTLAAACAKGVATSVASGNTNLVTSGAVYTALQDKSDADHTHNYLPLSGGTVTGTVSTSAAPAVTTAAFRNIKAITSTPVTPGSTAIPTGEIWVRYES